MSKEEAFSGVRGKFAAFKKNRQTPVSFTLPRSGIIAQIPQFINHGAWMKAQRLAGGDISKAQAAFVCEVVLFEGEKITMADVTEHVDALDMLALIGEIFGGDDDDEKADTGNDKAQV